MIFEFALNIITKENTMLGKIFRATIIFSVLLSTGCSKDSIEAEEEENSTIPGKPSTPNTKPGSDSGVNPNGKLTPEQYYFWKSSKTPQTGSNVYFASPTGKSSNTGTKDSPWDLATALDKFHTPGGSPKSGASYLYLREGIYTGGYVVKFNRDAGSTSSSLTVMPYPGEIAIFDATNNKEREHSLYVNGSNIIVEGLIFTSRNTNRLAGRDNVVGCGGVFDDGYNNRFISNIVHDVINSGIATEPNTKNSSPAATVSKAGGTLLYGNILFNCGFPVIGEQGHGNTIYLQNQYGTKRIENNILFNSFRDQITIYHSGKDIKNVEVIGNISFQAGAPGYVGMRNILAGCEGNLTDITIKNNSLYHNATNAEKSNLQVGYQSNGNNGLTVDGNIIYGGGDTKGSWGAVLEINRQWANSKFTNNLLAHHESNARLVWYPNIGNVEDRHFTFSGNRYYMGRANSNQASGETYQQNTYPANEARVYRIQGENRAYVAIFNFEKKDKYTVKVDGISGNYKVYDAQNLVGGAVIAEGSGSSIEFPLKHTKTFKPVGTTDGTNFRNVPHTPEKFNTFVVTW